MEAELLGRLTCPPINEHLDTSTDLTVSTVASLLYFDRVHTTTILPPMVRGDPHFEAPHKAVDHFFQRLATPGESSVIFDWNSLPKGTSCREALWVSYAPCVQELSRFAKEYRSL